MKIELRFFQINYAKLLTILLLLKSTTAFFSSIKTLRQTEVEYCQNDLITVVAGWLRKEVDISFRLSEFLVTTKDILYYNAAFRYHLTEFGAGCKTHTKGLYQFFGLVFEPIDAKTCQLSYIIHPKGHMKDCDDPANPPPNLLSLFQDKKKKTLEANKAIKVKDSFFLVDKDNIAQTPGYFNVFAMDDLTALDGKFEVILNGLISRTGPEYALMYQQRLFRRLHRAYKFFYPDYQLSPKKFLESMVYDNLPGYHLKISKKASEVSSEPDNSFCYSMDVLGIGLCKTEMYHFLVTDIDQLSEDISTFIRIMRVHSPKLDPQVFRDISMKISKPCPAGHITVETQDNRGTQLKIEIDQSTLNLQQGVKYWLHIALFIPNCVLFYNENNLPRAYSSIYLSVYYAGHKILKEHREDANFDDKYIFIPDTDNRVEVKISVTQTKKDGSDVLENVMGLRLFDLQVFRDGISNFEPESVEDKRCLMKRFVADQCVVFAFMDRKDDKPEVYLDQNNVRSSQTGPCDPKNCFLCSSSQCVIPGPGFNREISDIAWASEMGFVYDIESIPDPVVAKKMKEGRVRVQNNRGNSYWVKCPPSCKIQN